MNDTRDYSANELTDRDAWMYEGHNRKTVESLVEAIDDGFDASAREVRDPEYVW